MPAPKGRSKSAKKPSALELLKEEIGKKQLCIDDLNNQVKSLKTSIEYQVSEESRLRDKLQIIIPEIIAHRDRDRFPLEPVNSVVDVDEGYVREMIQSMIDDLRRRQTQKSLIEQRIDELEQRVTEQNDNYQSIVRKNLTCMKGISEALQSSSPHEIRFILRHVKQELLLEEPIRRPVSAPVNSGQLFTMTQLPPAAHESPLGDLQREYLRSMETVKLPRHHPVRKLPGDAHVKYLQSEIREAIVNELSIESSHRGDWRQFAHLVGITTETIQFWRRLECKCPMQQVISYWKDSQSADVRTLHRLLLSDQIKAVHLAKLVADFYHVD